jgi:hypothetical protein
MRVACGLARRCHRSGNCSAHSEPAFESLPSRDPYNSQWLIDLHICHENQTLGGTTIPPSTRASPELGPPVLLMSKDQADIELRTVLDDLGVCHGSRCARRCGSQKWVRANVFRRPQTQRDSLRMSAQVEGSRFDSVRR